MRVEIRRPIDVEIVEGPGRLVAVTVIFVLLGAALAAMIAPRLGQAGGVVGPLLLVAAALFAAIPLHLILQRRRWIVRLDADGVVLRGGGRRLAWSSLRRARRRRRKQHWNAFVTSHYQLTFAEGTAYFFPATARNAREVSDVLDPLVT